MPNYILNSGQIVVVNDDYSLSYQAIEQLTMTYLGFSEDLSHEGFAVWRNERSGISGLVSSRSEDVTDEQLKEKADELKCLVLDIRHDLGFAQQIVKSLSLVIEPVMYRLGSLAGVWRVSRLSYFDPFNVDIHGVISGINQPIMSESVNLLDAIYAAAVRVLGVGKEAYVYFRNGADGTSAEVISCDFEMTNYLKRHLPKNLVRTPDLDRFVTSSIPDDIYESVVEQARLLLSAEQTVSPNAPDQTEPDATP